MRRMKAGSGLTQGREAYARRAWLEAYESLSAVHEDAPLAAPDLELLATATFMLGSDDESMSWLERAHQRYLEGGETLRGVRCALWIGLHLASRGQIGPATGWLGRAQRLLENEGECAERGYLLLPMMFQHEAAGDFDAAAAAAGEAVRIAEHFGDRDLFALAVHGQGHMLMKDGRVQEGLALLDEGMVAVTAEKLSPIVTGIVYCGVILACQEVYEVRRAREWTRALSDWWALQPEMVAFTGRCLVHRAEILQLDGSWPDALEEARRAGERFVQTENPAAGLARYRQGELLRLQGEFAARGGSLQGGERVRLGATARPRAVTARAGTRRGGCGRDPPGGRGDLPPNRACAPAPGLRRDHARSGGDRERRSGVCRAARARARLRQRDAHGLVAHAQGAVRLAEGDAQAALVVLRSAHETWHALEAPYEIARTRVLVAEACRALGDEEAAALELEAARSIFERLGAQAGPRAARRPEERPARSLSAGARGPATRCLGEEQPRDRF